MGSAIVRDTNQPCTPGTVPLNPIGILRNVGLDLPRIAVAHFYRELADLDVPHAPSFFAAVQRDHAVHCRGIRNPDLN